LESGKGHLFWRWSSKERIVNEERRQRIALDDLDERLQCYRLQNARIENQLFASLGRYGQMTPIVVCRLEGENVMIDGFKRLRAARRLRGLSSLTAQLLEVDEQGAKAAIYNLNLLHQRPQELEEAWIVHSLVREDGLSQVEAARLLARHKSWVNRRLAMLERLCDAAREELRLGLLTPSVARQLTRLPVGNQPEVLHSMREASLNAQEVGGVVDLLLASSTQEQKDFVLSDPRKALRQSQDHYVHCWDPRLSTAGNRAAKQLGSLLDGLAKMQSWLRYQGRGQLQACDTEPLQAGFQRLGCESRLVAESVDDFLAELKTP
jgi:ParB-like chromosome segregation protein Spo0J